MKSKKNTSPVRSRDKVLQSLYEIELGGSTAEEILEDKIIQKNYPHFKDLLIGVTESISELDGLLQKIMERDLSGLDPIESCLLYTSPSPRDGLLSRMPSSA